MPQPPAVRLMTFIVQLYPRLLGAIFIFPAVQKLRYPDAIREVLRFDRLPTSAVDSVAWTIVATEFLLGAVLIIWPTRRVLLGSMILLAAYTAQLAYLLIRHGAPSCACLEGIVAYEDARRSNLLGFVRNICLLLAACLTWIQLPTPRTSGDNPLQSAAKDSNER
jgi:hypothetical protein